ncbi:hypothetical protein N802_08865 [Knoellia sinensis KCTC 19936]|uniref:Glyoxalase-like domain-containing protein n=1 Tax=Knoellia sinensis KCTC 19936 TaxID=1385520 RepID=A0A0A0J8Y0_9MICO|nr:hypothetical protein N802_08865 [Knoellia sinensis KCTC 19936]
MGIKWIWAFLDTVEGDADASEAFWQNVTRTRISTRRGEREEFATLIPEGGDPWVKVQRVFSGGGVHLDLDVDDVGAGAAEAARLGATVVHRYPDGTVIVMRSPGGFTFCITSWAHAGSPTTQIRIGEPDLLDQVCLDIPSTLFDQECSFWEKLTGWNRRPAGREFERLARPDGIPIGLLLQRLDTVTGEVGAHVDFACHDRGASRVTHEAAGATFVGEPNPDEWTVMRDPVGRVYCLTRRSP